MRSTDPSPGGTSQQGLVRVEHFLLPASARRSARSSAHLPSQRLFLSFAKSHTDLLSYLGLCNFVAARLATRHIGFSLCVWPERGWGDEGCQKPERGLAWLLAVERLRGCTVGRGGLLPRAPPPFPPAPPSSPAHLSLLVMGPALPGRPSCRGSPGTPGCIEPPGQRLERLP